jgi:hypothetical protein
MWANVTRVLIKTKDKNNIEEKLDIFLSVDLCTDFFCFLRLAVKLYFARL